MDEESTDLAVLDGAPEGSDPADALTEPEPEVAAAPADDDRYASLSADVGSLKDALAQVTGLLMAQLSGGKPADPAPAPSAPEEIPDLHKDPADKYVQYYARKAVGDELSGLKAQVAALQAQLAPMSERERFVSAYHQEAAAAKVDPKSMAAQVASLLDTDPDLRAMASTDPALAARLAIRMSQRSAPAAPAPARRPAHRPSSAAAPGTVSSRAPASFGEAINQSLREMGVPAGADFRFSMGTGLEEPQ